MDIIKETTDIYKVSVPEKIYEELYSKSGILYFLLDPEGRIISYNVTVQEKLGYEKNDLKGNYFLSLFSQADQENVERLLYKCLDRGYVRNIQLPIRMKGDQWLFICINGLAKNDQQGNAVYIRLYIQDISQIVRLERQNQFCIWLTKYLQNKVLTKSVLEEILNAIQDMMESEGVGLSIQQRDGENLIFGLWQETEIDPELYDDHFKKWNADYWRQFIDICNDSNVCQITLDGGLWTGSLSDLISKIQSNDMKERLLSLAEFESLMILPIISKNKLTSYLILVHHSELKWDRQSVEFLQGIVPIFANTNKEESDPKISFPEIDFSIFHVSMFGVLAVKNNIIQYANKRIAELLELSTEEMYGKSLTAFIDPEYHDIIREMTQKDKKQEEDKDCQEVVMLTKNQKRLSIYCAHVRMFMNEISMDIWYWINKEDQERFERQLLHARKMESFGMLAGGIVHDFNNLLACILGFSSLLSEEIPEESPYYDDILQITKTSEKAAELTSRLMAYAQDSSYVVNNLDVNQLIKEVDGILSRTLDKRISVRADLDPKLVTLKADASQIQQAILQVALNARDAIPDGGKIHFQTRNIFINENDARLQSGRKPGRYVQIVINDTGLGMSGQVKDRIFDRDFTTKDKIAGRGLGLSMVQEIVDRHNGFISVFSEKSKGTVFKIHLPAGEKIIPQSQFLNNDKPSLGKETILLVDDEKVLRETARKMLTRYGYRVISAESGPEAASIYKKHVDRIDLIILDLIMPGMRVEKVISWMKKLNPKVKIMATSEIGEVELMKSNHYQYVAG
ncbi:PAS domain S-box protein, partial [bacterium]|nr:PAS domain S-box protein [bacterium]